MKCWIITAAAIVAVSAGWTPARAEAGWAHAGEPAPLTQLAAMALAADATSAAADLPFGQHTWTFQTYGSAGFADPSSGEIYTGHVGVGYHIFDNVSVNIEAFGGWVRSTVDDDGGVGGFDLLVRWHFIHVERFSIYVDGGAGFQQATTNFPSDSHYNFRPQAGLGATLEITQGMRLMGGARWLHISNAGATDTNAGMDGLQLYAGLMLPF